MKHIKIYEEYVNESLLGGIKKIFGEEPHFSRIEYPAEEFSNSTGIRVHQNWNIPGDDLEIQNILKSMDAGAFHKDPMIPDEELIQETEDLWKIFVVKNPFISSWVERGSPMQETKQKWDIMFGMVSRYNEDDIRSFLKRRGMNVSPEDERRVEMIENKTGKGLEWVPSLKTLDFIEKNLEKS
jgi:hypothetical protein